MQKLSEYKFLYFGQKSLMYQDFAAYSLQDETLQLHSCYPLFLQFWK